MTEPLPGLVDTHCHLVLLEERNLLGAAWESTALAGVEQIVTVGLNVDDSDRNREIAEAHPGVFFTVGWHPHEAKPPDRTQLEALDAMLGHPLAVAVGEIGLDAYYRPKYHETPIHVQLAALHAMLELADSHQKPVVIHTRDTDAEILGALRAWPRVRGVMHCFSGDAAFATECVSLGYIVSFSGIVTFPKSDGIQAAARSLPPESYTVETDAPFLAPVPHRGRPNLPGYVADTARSVAVLRGEGEDVVRRQAAANARELFTIGLEPRLAW